MAHQWQPLDGLCKGAFAAQLTEVCRPPLAIVRRLPGREGPAVLLHRQYVVCYAWPHFLENDGILRATALPSQPERPLLRPCGQLARALPSRFDADIEPISFRIQCHRTRPSCDRLQRLASAP